jgi:hypothetical protein
MSDRKTFVAGLLNAQPDIKQLELSRRVREAFGTGLSFVHVRQLREAWLAGSFDRVWSELFGTEEDEQRSANEASRKKLRGDRRRKTQLRGRRGIDADKVVMREFHNHLVVYRTHDGRMNSQAFNSRKRAEGMVNELLNEGVPANEIGYFCRNEIKATVVL